MSVIPEVLHGIQHSSRNHSVFLYAGPPSEAVSNIRLIGDEVQGEQDNKITQKPYSMSG